MQKTIHKILLPVLIIILILHSPPTTAQVSEYTGINLLFIVDQSGSMGGIRFGGLDIYGDGNDVSDLRFVGPQYALNLLSSVRGASVDADKMDIYFAVLSFGTFPRLIQDWVLLDPSDEAALAQINENISAERFGERNLQLTNFLDAFRDAETSFFRSLPGAPGKKYLNVIITLTDGAPCAPGETVEDAASGEQIYLCDTINSQNRPLMEAHLQRLNALVENSFGSRDYELYVIGLDAEGDRNEFWSALASLWAEVVCKDVTDVINCNPDVRYKRVLTTQGIGIQLQKILEDVLGTVSPDMLPVLYNGPLPASFNVPPYQQFMRIDLFKKSANLLGTVSVNGPFGAVTPNSDVGDDTAIRMIGIDAPVSGNWTITSASNDQVEIAVVQTLPAGIEMEPVTDGELLSAIPLTTRLVRGDGSPLSNTPGSPELLVEALVYDSTLPDRETRPLVATIPLPRDLALSDIYQFNGIWTPEKAGLHEIRVRASYLDTAGATQILINGQTMQDGIRIAGATIEWEGITPLSQRVGLPFTAHARIVNNNTGLPIANIVALSMRAVVTYPDDSPYTEILMSNTSGVAGEMLSQFPIPDPGDYRVRLEIGREDAVSGFVVIGLPSDNIPVTVRALRPVSLTIMQPAVDTVMDAQAVSLSPPMLNLFTPFTVQVGIRDVMTNTWVSLADVTGGAESKPRLVMNPGDNEIDLSDTLLEVQPGIYAATVEGLWPGSYEFSSSVSTSNEMLTGDYLWQGANPISHTLTRVWSIGFIVAALVLVLVVVGSIVLAVFIIVRDRQLREHPLTGTISFVMRPMDPAQYGESELLRIDLGRVTRNKQVFRSKDLPAPFEYLVLRRRSTDSEGNANIEALRFNGEDKAGRLLLPGSEYTVGRDDETESIYLIAKDGNVSAGLDFLTAAKKS